MTANRKSGLLCAVCAVCMGLNGLAGVVEVGTGTLFYDQPALQRPLSSDAGRYQILVLAEQLEGYAESNLVAVAFDANVHPAGAASFDNVVIRVVPTTVAKLSDTFADNYAGQEPVEVLNVETLTLEWSARGWHRIEFSRPFKYDGKSNLVIEFQHDGNEDGKAIRTTRWAAEPGRVLDGTVTSLPGQPRLTDGGALVSGHLRPYMNGLRVVFAAAE